MSLLAAIRTLWRSITPRTRSDVEEESRSTLDAYQDHLIRQGLSTEEARRKARIHLGQPGGQNEIYRDAIGLRFFDELGGDIRYGLRALRRNPGFAAVAVVVSQNFSRPQTRPFLMEMPRIRSSLRHSANTLENRNGVCACSTHIY